MDVCVCACICQRPIAKHKLYQASECAPILCWMFHPISSCANRASNVYGRCICQSRIRCDDKIVRVHVEVHAHRAPHTSSHTTTRTQSQYVHMHGRIYVLGTLLLLLEEYEHTKQVHRRPTNKQPNHFSSNRRPNHTLSTEYVRTSASFETSFT